MMTRYVSKMERGGGGRQKLAHMYAPDDTRASPFVPKHWLPGHSSTKYRAKCQPSQRTHEEARDLALNSRLDEPHAAHQLFPEHSVPRHLSISDDARQPSQRTDTYRGQEDENPTPAHSLISFTSAIPRSPIPPVQRRATPTTCTSSTTTLVRLRKENGIITQDCDVYIGPRIQNTSWQLETSIWANPFHRSDCHKTSIESYRNHVLTSDVLRPLLPSLYGKILGCFCTKLKKCHGNELVKLVNDSNLISHVVVESKYLFFKGEFCPLSSLFKSPLKVNGRVFSCLEHARAFTVANAIGKVDLVKKLSLIDIPTKELIALSREVITSNHFKTQQLSAADNINLMRQLLKLKLEQDAQFRKIVRMHKRMTFVEATCNYFWACGTDLSNIILLGQTGKIRMNLFPGMNILGWLITEAANDFKSVQITEKGFIPSIFNGRRMVIESQS